MAEWLHRTKPTRGGREGPRILRIDSSIGRAPGSYPGGCEVKTRSIYQFKPGSSVTRAPLLQGGRRRFDSAPGDQF